MGFAVSIVVFAVGAVLRFATNIHSSTWNIPTIGDILMIVGAVGFVLSVLAWAYWDGFGSVNRRRFYSRTTSSAPPVYGHDGFARTTYADPDPTRPVSVGTPAGYPTVVEEEHSTY
jgi:hypothetical protein